MDIDIRRLRLLREVAARGTIAAAAESLGYTPSAVSQQLGVLEREAGTPLLERTGRRVQLTDAGQLLAGRTEPILVALEEAKAALEEWKTTVAGSLRVAASGSVARALVIPVMARVAKENAQLDVAVLEYGPSEAVTALRLGEVDAVVTHEYDHDRRQIDGDLVRVDLFSDDLLAAVPTGRFTAPLSLAALRHERWAAEPAGSACGKALREACRAVGFEPDVRYHTTESSNVLAAVATGDAVSLLPWLAFVGCPPGVEAVELAGEPTRRLIYAARRRGQPARPSVTLLIDQLLRALVDEPMGQRHGQSEATANN